MPEITVMSKTPYAWVNAKRELVQSTFVVYKDKEGRVGTIVVQKKEPSDSEIQEAIKKRAAGA